MFGLFNSHKRQLSRAQSRYETLLKEARDLQRAGKIQAFAKKTAEAEAAKKEWDALKDDAQSA